MMPRYLHRAIQEDAFPAGKMALVSGPRQVGKTTLGKGLLQSETNYFNWDDETFRRAWVRSPSAAVERHGSGPILLDEIHKDRRWKTRLKGLYDTRGRDLRILVTGSARLDLYRRGGDSLLGRYLPYRLHPFTVGETDAPPGPDALLQPREVRFPWNDLIRLGGFPEPLLDASEAKALRWSRLRVDRLVREDVRDLRAVSDLAALRVLTDLLSVRSAGLLSVNSLREEIGLAHGTVNAWILALEALYHCFLVRPYAARTARALRSQPKLYLYDILRIPKEAEGARRETLSALHLLKACHLWTDTAIGEFQLRFVRDKEKREVDFLVLRDRRPWLLVECKSGEMEPAPNLRRFTRALRPAHSVQLVSRPGTDRPYPALGIRVVDYERFFSSLP
ncbi:MAG: ATP-binding protein [Planctomycetes bacterium]|nr:ATP-binding protein [Planctomycetota bacterium]